MEIPFHKILPRHIVRLPRIDCNNSCKRERIPSGCCSWQGFLKEKLWNFAKKLSFIRPTFQQLRFIAMPKYSENTSIKYFFLFFVPPEPTKMIPFFVKNNIFRFETSFSGVSARGLFLSSLPKEVCKYLVDGMERLYLENEWAEEITVWIHIWSCCQVLQWKTESTKSNSF